MRLDLAFLALFGSQADGSFLEDCQLSDLTENEPPNFEKWDCSAYSAPGYV